MPNSSPLSINKPFSGIVGFDPGELSASLRQVARYAGGKGYELDARTGDIAAAAIERAGSLATPAFAYAVHRAVDLSDDGSLQLENGTTLKLPVRERDRHIKYLAALICTIGPSLEKTCSELARQGDFPGSLFLDAAGTAMLEDLSIQASRFFSDYAESAGLAAGCLFAPGYMDMPISDQGLLFQLVDGECIGVSLNSKMIMKPSKSLAFFIRLTADESSARHVYKCVACPAKECPFRLV
jgi:hypothetical protein